MTTHECPKCGPVPDVELFGVEYPEVYDGVLFWVHGKCGTAWPRNADWEASVAAARAHNERGERVSRSSVVPWWGRLLPWVCLFVALGCFSWSLGIDDWRLTVFVLGLAAHVGGHEVRKANDEATREIK